MTIEVPVEFADWSTVHWSQRHRSINEIEALMVAPGLEPDEPLVQFQLLREAVADCFEQLSAEDQFVLEALWFEQITVRALAERMGLHKSYTHRIAQRAIKRLEAICREHPVIVQRLRLRDDGLADFTAALA